MLAGGGCASLSSDEPPTVVLFFEASDDLNPDAQGRPSPVVLRIYALDGDEIFNGAEFFSLYQDDAAILGDSLTSVREIELVPGQSLEFGPESFEVDTDHVAVMVAYRDLDNAKWRSSFPVEADKKTKIDVNVGKLSVTMEEH